jgi:hypothetical protein
VSKNHECAEAYCAECETKNTRQRSFFAKCQSLALGKDNGRQLWTAADGPLPSASIRRVFDTRKDFFAECISVPRVLLSVNAVVTESKTSPSAALSKDVFAECGTRQRRLCRVRHSAKKSTRQSAGHSAKSRILVVMHAL